MSTGGMAMDHPYLDLSRPGEPRERTTYFVLDSLLRSRIDCGFESNTGRYDEDVNVYLVELLSGLMHCPGFAAADAQGAVDVFQRVRDVQNPRLKSRVYRASADHLLVSTGLFVDTPYVAREGRRDFDAGARDRIGRGKEYYHWAALFQERAPAGSKVFARILQLLSEDFERWVDVLFHMRGEYFHLYERLRDESFAALAAAAPATAAAPEDAPPPADAATAARDDFLDAYWSWHHEPSAAARTRLESAVARLREADPTFRFDLPQ